MNIHRFFCATLFFVTTTVSAQTGDTLINSIVFGGNIRGFNKTWKNGDGSFTNWYQFNDRGRGDSLVTIYRQDEEGFPTFIAVGGKDYFKNEVHEDFSLENGIAKWKNIAENEERTVNGKLFYSALKGQGGGNIVKALKKHNNTIRLLPFGEVNLQVMQDISLGEAAAAKKLWLCRLSGFSLTPNYSWVDENDEPFASVSEWASDIRKGYENYADTLLSVQRKIEDAFYTKLAKEIPEKIPGTVLIKNVNLFNSENGKISVHSNVLITDGIVTRISAGEKIKTTADRIIDGTGKTLLPGLWDMHVHYADESDGILHMAAGVIHVRDMGNGPPLLFKSIS